MTTNYRAAIIIPCYNEEGRLSVDDISSYVQQYSDTYFLLVDDGSSDKTAEIIQQVASTSEHVEALVLPNNMGKCRAVREAVHSLSQNSFNFPYLGYWDADFACPLNEIRRFFDYAEKHAEVDFFMGCRLQRLGARIRKQPFRHYISRGLATVFSQLLKLRVYDTQCGAKLLRKETAEDLFEQEFRSSWIFDVELIFRFIAKVGREEVEKRVYEIPLNEWIDRGDSKMRMSYFPKMFWEIMRLAWVYRLKGKTH